MVTERGTSFGYHDLIVDMRGLFAMRAVAPVCFDATHAVQHPGAGEGASSGDRSYVAPLAARRGGARHRRAVRRDASRSRPRPRATPAVPDPPRGPRCPARRRGRDSRGARPANARERFSAIARLQARRARRPSVWCSRRAPVRAERPPARAHLPRHASPRSWRAERVFVLVDRARARPGAPLRDLRDEGARGILRAALDHRVHPVPRFAIPHFAAGLGRSDLQRHRSDLPRRSRAALRRGARLVRLSQRRARRHLSDAARLATACSDTGRSSAAQRESKRRLHARARAVPGLWGPLDPA